MGINGIKEDLLCEHRATAEFLYCPFANSAVAQLAAKATQAIQVGRPLQAAKG